MEAPDKSFTPSVILKLYVVFNFNEEDGTRVIASPPPVPLTFEATRAPVPASIKYTVLEVMVELFIPPFGNFKTLVEIDVFSLTF